MNISNLKITEIISVLLSKIAELTKTTDLSKINFTHITSFIMFSLILFFTSTVILWLLKSIALYKMAKNKNDPYAFLAFIPYFCLFVEGKIIGETSIFGINIKHTEYLLPALLVSCLFPFTMHISFILLILFSLAITYKLYKMYIPHLALVLFILTIILPVIMPFVLFFIKDNSAQSV